MIIRRVAITDLLGKKISFDNQFNADINILTGRNGAGKTSFLKLVWYIMSGNILQALREVPFEKALVETDEYTCEVFRLSRLTCRIEYSDDKGTRTFEDQRDHEGDVFINAEDQAHEFLVSRGSTVFFPTFRRIEGGFSLAPEPAVGRVGNALARSRRDIEDALQALAKRLSETNHIFVSSISTVDIVGLLLRQFADLSQISNEIQQETSREIIDKIKAYEADSPGKGMILEGVGTADSVIDDIRSLVEDMEVRRKQTMSPIEAVRALVEKLFQHTGIKFGARLNFGDAATAINSDALSAGEKQMLSFICYNAFYKNAVFFIDEPELSLHVDWQRQLFPILLGQNSSNQFVIATHSPFIYTKYLDKEIALSDDRGDMLD